MANFTAKDVKDLREKTGCGMMDCKKALTESDGDVERAIELLREKGLAALEKKAGRIAAEGIVDAYVSPDSKVGAIIEVNSETDFVGKNADFKAFVAALAKTVAEKAPSDVDALLKLTYPGSEMTVEEMLREKILTIGEKLNIRRFQRFEGNVTAYIHGDGRIGVMADFDTDIASKDGFETFAKDVCMQIAAVNPQYISSEDVPAEVIDKEKEILTQQALNEGKPANIAEKMVMGRIKKFYKEVCLNDQEFVKDSDLTVKGYMDKTAKELGGSISVRAFVRFEKGEGLEKREDNFADEVASMIK